MLSGQANCLLRIITRSYVPDEFGQGINTFVVWREAWARSWVDRGAEPVQANEPQSSPIRNFQVDWGDVYLPDPDGTVIREDMVIEVAGEDYRTPDGVVTPRRYDIMILKPDWGRRSFCNIVCKERRNHQ